MKKMIRPTVLVLLGIIFALKIFNVVDVDSSLTAGGLCSSLSLLLQDFFLNERR